MSDNARRIAQLQDEIAALRIAIGALAALPEAQQPLHDQLAQKERELAALQQAGGATPPSGRTHTQHISGNAQVGTAIAGDVHGPVTNTQQSGGVNFGSGNRIGVLGDFVGGDKVQGDKVQGDKITHYGAYGTPPPADTSPEHLRLLIELHTRRLRVLETQAARTGYNARPEVVNEIEEIQAEIARLEALLAGA